MRAKRWQADRFLRAAAEAKKYAEVFPDSANAPEATRLEAKNIFQAAMAGDVSQEGRAQEILGRARVDQKLSSKARLELVALSELVRLRPLFPDRDKFLPAYEQSIRNQIMEFPKEPAAYESFLRFAENLPEEADTVKLATEIATRMPAPDSVKAAANDVLAKHALVGQPIAPLLAAATGKASSDALVQGRSVVVYTWSAQSPGSIAAAQNLAKSLPATVQLIGVNLDADGTAAKEAASKDSLPGQQFYDSRGFDGPLAQALKLRRYGEVYVTDSSGVIRTVSAQKGDLTAKLGYAAR